MIRVMAYTSPARGHLFPLTPILDELRRRGHDISVRTLASQVPLMHSRGFAAAPISAHVEAVELEDWRAGGSQKALAAAVRAFCARAEFDADDLRQAIRDEQPDAVLVDINAWGALAAAEQWGGPWAAFCPYPLALRSDQVPPFGPGLPPAEGLLGRTRDRLLRPVVLGAIERQMVPSMNGVRQALGLPPLRHADDLFHRPPLLVYLTSEPFEYHRVDWPDNIVMVGPCDWEPPSEPPSWLAEIEQPLVLVTTSSEFQDDGRLVKVALEALADLPVHVVATIPSGDPADYAVPANAHVERFLAHGPLLDRAVCAVTHGGMGATQKALARGVPVCAVPFGRDQLEVARRIEVAAAGTRLTARRLTAARLRAKVMQAMTMTQGAARVAAGFKAAGGPSAAANAIEARLFNPPPSADSQAETRNAS
ncbi:MAG: glycosyltransferase [Actinomycetota bacterium]|nr:glycosyltransferase [Actinomycetota bacterium]